MIKRQETTDQKFQREMVCLELFRCLRHSNIIEMLGCYTHRGEHNILFPWLPSDLAALLKSELPPGNFSNNMTFLNALYNLSSAIDKIHNFSLILPGRQESLSTIGYHHDIRPKNILVTQSTFVLADFGLAGFKESDEDSKTGWKNGVGDYIAPECMDEDFSPLKTGRAIDIWSFGCLVAEIASYIHGGPSHVKLFRKDREKTNTSYNHTEYYFFEWTAQGSPILKGSVHQFLATLSKSSNGPVRSLANVALMILQAKEEDRPNSGAVRSMLDYTELKALYQKAAGMWQDINNQISTTNRPVSRYHQIEMQFEEQRYRAWGQIVGFDSSQIDNILVKEYSPIVTRQRSNQNELRLRLSNYLATLYILEEKSRASEDERISVDAAVPEIVASEELRRLVRELWDATPPSQQRRMEHIWRQSLIDGRDTDALQRLEGGAQDLYGDNSDLQCHMALKRLISAMWTEVDRANPEQRKLILSLSQVEKTDALDEYHEIGWYDPSWYERAPSRGKQRVLTEWMLYTPLWDKQSEEAKVVKVLALAELLHYPKPKSFCVLDCVGVIPPSAASSHEGFGFVYSLPGNWSMDSTHKITSLGNILQRKGYAITLDDKFRIASSLASSIYELHSAGWLHKNVKSSNVLLLANRHDDSEAIGGPYLIGLRHSRPDGKIWISDTKLSDISYESGANDVFGHPEVHPSYLPGSAHTRFVKAFDVYGLGIVLLEIGLWRSIAAFHARHLNENRTGFSNLLRERYVPRLSQSMGTLYRDVVIACITSDIQEHKDDLTNFYQNVVAKLYTCKVGS